jgi:hypothetical protein
MATNVLAWLWSGELLRAVHAGLFTFHATGRLQQAVATASLLCIQITLFQNPTGG